jgi:hypothetical protein
VDGYLANCSVCLDSNNNQVCDSNEPATVTEPDGTFKFVTDQSVSSSLIVEPGVGCLDSGTGRPLESKLVAPSGSAAITPLTQVLSVFPSTITTAEAAATLQSAFGLPILYDLDTYDPFQAVFENQPGSRDALIAVLKLATLWDTVTGLCIMDNKTQESIDAACAAAAQVLVSASSSSVDDPTILAALLQTVAFDAGLSQDSTELLTAAQLTITLWGLEKTALTDAPNATSVAYQFSQWRIVSQTYLREQMTDYFSGNLTAEEYAARTTPSNMATEAAKIQPPILGCMDSRANNYNPSAEASDGSCTFDPVQCEQYNCSTCITKKGCFFCSGEVHVCMPEGFLPQGVSGLDYCRLFMQGAPSYACTQTYNECQEISPSPTAPCNQCIGQTTPGGARCGRCDLATGGSICLNDLPDTVYGYGSFTRTVCSNIATAQGTTATWLDPSYQCPTTAPAIFVPSPSGVPTNPTSTSTPVSSSSEDGGLSGGAIAGIVIAVLVIVGAIVAVLVCFFLGVLCFGKRSALSSKESANLDMIFVDENKDDDDVTSSSSGFSRTPQGDNSYTGSESPSRSMSSDRSPSGSLSGSVTPSGSGSADGFSDEPSGSFSDS